MRKKISWGKVLLAVSTFVVQLVVSAVITIVCTVGGIVYGLCAGIGALCRWTSERIEAAVHWAKIPRYVRLIADLILVTIAILFLVSFSIWMLSRRATIVRKPVAVLVPEATQPAMPIRATDSGPLTGMLLVIDPGHGGNTSWGGVDPGCPWDYKGETLREAAYTYRLAKEVGEMVLAQGGDVVFTAWSATMEVSTPPSVAMPLPIEPLLPSGGLLPNDKAGLIARADVAGSMYNAHKAEYKLVVFISLHIDSMEEGWSGLHVCYDGHAGSAPRLAELMAQAIKDGHYERRHNGKDEGTLEGRGLAVLRSSHNPLKHRVLLECGIPGNDGDSWRLRNEPNRRAMEEKVILRPLVQLKKETDEKGGAQ